MRTVTIHKHLINVKDLTEGKELLTKDEIETMYEPVSGSITLLKEGNRYKLNYLTRDAHASNPRKNADPLGTMVCFHKKYNLGDEHNYSANQFDSWYGLAELIEELDGKIAVSLPLYLLDHSGITMRTSKSSFVMCDPAGWDWGTVGIIYVTEKKAKEEYKVDEITDDVRETIINCLQSEVEEYDNYLTGEVYGTVFETIDENFERADYDTCWGYYGREAAKEALKEEW